MEVKKSPKADLEKTKGMGVLMGMVVGLAVLFVGFEWGTRDIQVVTADEGVADIIAEEEIEITRPENTPPPPAPVVTEVLNVVDDDVELEQQEIVTSEDSQTEAQTQTFVAPVVEEEEEESAQQIFTVVEEMPDFPDGGLQGLLKFLAKNIKYPVIAQENGIQGRVVCAFVVNKDGSIVDIEVLRGVDPSLDKEAVRVLGTMPKWKPGKQRGKPVRVKYTVPVMFRLQ